MAEQKEDFETDLPNVELQDYETLQEFAKAAKAKLDQNAWDTCSAQPTRKLRADETARRLTVWPSDHECCATWSMLTPVPNS